jgi:5,10-methylenetetrahydrofolate reductase
VTAVTEQEWQQVAARKALLTARYERIADLATEKQINQLESNEKIPLSVLLSVGGTAIDKVLALRGEPSLTVHHEHTHTHQQELLIDLIKKFNLDPAVIIQNMQHGHTNSPMQKAGIAI